MASLDAIDRTIERLGAELEPVRRLPPPLARAALWLAGVSVLAAALACFSNLTSVAHRIGAAPDLWVAALASTLTSALAAAAAFELSVPGRSAWWAALPLPTVLVWLGASGLGCLRGWLVPGADVASMGEMRGCFLFIVGLSIPLSALMVAMVRRACPLRPNLTAAMGGLAVAAGSSTLLNLFHPHDAAATDLAVHLVAVGIVIGLNAWLGERLLGHPTR